MSTETLDIETATCSHCDGPRDPHDSVHGSYCSLACYYRDKGAGILAQLDTDGRICSTCYGQVREIERLPDASYQYKTERTVIGVDGYVVGDGIEIEGTRWSCQCGAVDPGDCHPEIQALDLEAARENLYRALVDLHRRDAIAAPPDRDLFFAAFEAPWRGAAYAAGRAVYGGAED